MTLLASSLATARPLDLASRRQQMTPQPPPRASAGDGSALLMLLLLLSQPLLLLLLLSQLQLLLLLPQPLLLLPLLSGKATDAAAGEQKMSRAEPTFELHLLMGECSPLLASRGSPVS